MGCCTLLAIQQVVAVSPQDRDDLDYSASYAQPEDTKVGCGYRDLVDSEPDASLIKAQQEAELNHQDWIFTDPRRVAAEAIARFANIDAKSVTSLITKKQSASQIIYEFTAPNTTDPYMLVVSRPYLLSFYAPRSKARRLDRHRRLPLLLRFARRAQLRHPHPVTRRSALRVMALAMTNSCPRSDYL